jgi:hypothetical protein
MFVLAHTVLEELLQSDDITPSKNDLTVCVTVLVVIFLGGECDSIFSIFTFDSDGLSSTLV